jgi:hypothetical protein
MLNIRRHNATNVKAPTVLLLVIFIIIYYEVNQIGGSKPSQWEEEEGEGEYRLRFQERFAARNRQRPNLGYHARRQGKAGRL